MSAKLKDFRGELTFETDVWLETETRTTGRTRQEIVRERLHEIACRELAKYRLGVSLAAANGILPASAGAAPELAGFNRRRSHGS